MNPLECELQGILMVIQHCWSMGFRKVILENDCSKEIDILNGKTLHFSLYNWIREIKWWVNCFDEVRFRWISRKANKCADKLARRGPLPSVFFIFHNYVPNMLTNLLHEDYVNSSIH